jgi:hypothetical protein
MDIVGRGETSGTHRAEESCRLGPELPVLFDSGYSEKAVDDVRDVRVEIDFGVRQVDALALAGQARGENFLASGVEQRAHLAPQPGPLPAAVDQ